eukprot:6398573-Prymnesium_polylepis.2
MVDGAAGAIIEVVRRELGRALDRSRHRRPQGPSADAQGGGCSSLCLLCCPGQRQADHVPYCLRRFGSSFSNLQRVGERRNQPQRF